MNVQTIMSRNPYTLHVGDTLAQAVELMSNEDIRHVPVLDNGRVAGIISDRDVKMALGPDAYELDLASIDPRMAEGPLSWFMSQEVVSVAPTDPLAAVAERFIELKVGALPVVEGGELVGIVSVLDVLRVALPLLRKG